MKAELIPESSQQSAGEEGGGAAAAEASNEPKESAAEASKESEDGNEGEEVAKKEGEKGRSEGIKVEYLHWTFPPSSPPLTVCVPSRRRTSLSTSSSTTLQSAEYPTVSVLH